MVNSNPYSAHGPMRGSSRVSYHRRPLALSPSRRVRYPDSKRDAQEHQHRFGDLPRRHIEPV